MSIHSVNMQAGRMPAASRRRRSTTATPLYYIGQNSRGHWVVRDGAGQSGGIFIDRSQAIKFALFENDRHPEAVIMVPGLLELDLK